MSRDHQKREVELNFKYQEALNRFQQHPSNEAKLEIDKLKREIETLYKSKRRVLIVRSRAHWHEYGEKNSKIFST